MKFDLNEAITILSRTPEMLNTLLKDLPNGFVNNNEGEETWSPYDVIGHLIEGEKSDWLTRTKIILSEQNYEAFIPFDRFAQFENSKGKSMDELLGEFIKLRNQNIIELKGLKITDNQLKREGVHPEFGKVTLKQLLSTWVAHDMGHLMQISRVIAKQYTDEVGPWKKYLSLFHE